MILPDWSSDGCLPQAVADTLGAVSHARPGSRHKACVPYPLT